MDGGHRVLGERTSRTVNSSHHGGTHAVNAKSSKQDKGLWEAVKEIQIIINLNEDRGVKKSVVSDEEKTAMMKVKYMIKRGASINRALVLHRAVANKFEKRTIQFLVDLGGDVNMQDSFGATPMHQAAAQHNEAIQWLIDLGAKKRVTSLQGTTPMFYLRKKWLEHVATFHEEILTVPARDSRHHLEYVLALMPSTQKATLISYWLSPRMKFQLLRSAEIEGDAFSDGCGNLSYIPDHLYRNFGTVTTFLKGYQACFFAAAHCLRNGKAPTVNRIKKCATRSIREYLALGGKVEYALDAIIDLASSCDIQYLEEDDEDYQALPETELDDDFEIAKAMCIDYGGGKKMEEKGPYADRTQDHQAGFSRDLPESFSDPSEDDLHQLAIDGGVFRKR